MISSPLVSNVKNLCFNFWFDIRVSLCLNSLFLVKSFYQVDAGIKYMKVETEVGDNSDSREAVWEVRPEHGRDEWQVGRVNIMKPENFKILISAARSDKLLGYVAIDDFEFVFDGEYCTIMPPEAAPGPGPTPTPSPAPGASFPDCKFESDECGWVIDNFDAMKWYRTNAGELIGAGLDSPNEDKDGNFIYVSARNGSEGSSTIFATPMVEKSTVQGCMRFYFSLNVSI